MKNYFRGVMQHDAQDCGAACLTSIIHFWGNNAPMSLIREKMKVDKSGSNFYTIGIVGEQFGLTSTALNGTLDELLEELKNNRLQLPFIAHFLNNHSKGHFVVVYKYSNSKITIFDPGEGKQVLTFEQFNKKWSGSILTFSKNDSWEDNNQFNKNYIKLINVIASERKNFFYTILYSLGISLISIAGAFFYKNVIDNMILNNGKSNTFDGILGQIISRIDLLLLVLVILYFCQLIISLLNGFVLAKMAERINNNLMLLFFRHMIGLPLEFIDRTDSGSILSRFHNITEIQNQGINMILSMVLDTILAIVGAIILYSISPILFMSVVVILVIYVFITIIFISPLKNVNRNVQKEHSDLLTIINEVLSGIGTIKLQQGEGRFIHKFHDTTLELSKGLFKILSLKNILNSLVVLVESIGTLIIIWIGSKLVISDTISLGELVAFESLTTFFIIPVKNIIKSFGEFQNTLVSIGRVTDILEIEKEYSDSKSNKSFTKQIKTVQLKNVDYQYNLVNKSLDNIDITINTGSIIGITGTNGSGKTTLLKMIGTLINPKKGEIIYEGTKLSKDRLPDIRSKLAYVSQDPYVFEGTLRDNLTLGNSMIVDEEINRICIEFGLFELTSEGNGLGLFLLENGENLSGGQKQKVGLARAILSNPEILLLDEATSSLDKESEKKVFEYLNSIKKNMIIISIFHEDSFMKFVDRFIVMDKGRIIYDGFPLDK